MAETGETIVGFVVVAIIGMLILLVFSQKMSSMRDEMLQNVARCLGGAFVEGGFLEEPSIRYSVDGREARMEFRVGGENSEPYSRITIDLRGRGPGSLHILEEGFGQSFLKLFGAQDLSVGEPEFDRDYVVKATPESTAARVFSAEHRSGLIRAVRSLRGYRDPTFDVERTNLTVRVREYLRNEEGIQALAWAAAEFLKHLVPPDGSPGIVLGEVLVRAEGACPVCETALGDRAPRCELCGTPQHPECWDYMARCATYACGGRRVS